MGHGSSLQQDQNRGLRAHLLSVIIDQAARNRTGARIHSRSQTRESEPLPSCARAESVSSGAAERRMMMMRMMMEMEMRLARIGFFLIPGFVLLLSFEGFPLSTGTGTGESQRSTDNITVRQGDTAVIRCYVDDRVSKVAWLNRSNIIFAGQDKWSLDARVQLLTHTPLEYTLRIQKVCVCDEGPYTCSIQTPSRARTSQVYLIVTVPASIYQVSEDVSVNEGGNLTLSCLANGRPDPTVTWRLLSPAAEALEVGEYLEISGILRSQAGRYECKASNDVTAPDVKYVNVVVNYRPIIRNVRGAEASLGQSGVLHCEATAVPQPEFEWYREERRLLSSQTLSIQNAAFQSILLLSNVTEADYGNYTCVATNRLGTHTSSVFLYKPGMGQEYSASVNICQSSGLLFLGVASTFLLKC